MFLWRHFTTMNCSVDIAPGLQGQNRHTWTFGRLNFTALVQYRISRNMSRMHVHRCGVTTLAIETEGEE